MLGRLSEISLIGETMIFTGLCIETDNVQRLVQFYEMIFQTESKGDNIHSSFDDQKLAIFNPEKNIEQKSCRSFVLMYEVQNVDEIYNRLLLEDVRIISAPTVKPWGTKTLSLLDPDGNRVNLLQPISK